jgi:hypothetical protein
MMVMVIMMVMMVVMMMPFTTIIIESPSCHSMNVIHRIQ